MKLLKVDAKKRVLIPDAKPDAVFAYEPEADGRIVLTPVAPVESRPVKVRFVKKDGYTVGVTDQPVTEEMIKAAMADFP